MRKREGSAENIDFSKVCVCGGESVPDYKAGYPARRCVNCDKIWYLTTCLVCNTTIDERFSKECHVCHKLHCPSCGSCDPSGVCTCEGFC